MFAFQCVVYFTWHNVSQIYILCCIEDFHIFKILFSYSVQTCIQFLMLIIFYISEGFLLKLLYSYMVNRFYMYRYRNAVKFASALPPTYVLPKSFLSFCPVGWLVGWLVFTLIYFLFML